MQSPKGPASKVPHCAATAWHFAPIALRRPGIRGRVEALRCAMVWVGTAREPGHILRGNYTSPGSHASLAVVCFSRTNW